jgi:CRP-like cAMP-binding protein
MRLEDYLDKVTETRDFAKGAVIFKQGQQADAAFYIIEGTVEIFQQGDATLAELGPGQIFGEMALLRFDSYTLSARAVSPLKVHIITPDMLQEQLRNTPPLVKAILDMLVERVRTVNEVLIDLDRAAQG